MAAISASNHDVITKLVPGGVHSLAHLDDQQLLRSTRRLVEHIEQKRGQARHESLAAQADVLKQGARPTEDDPNSS